MAFDLKQSLKLTQQLLMTPQLQQAIKLLQLSRVELEEFVAQQLAENPVLEEGISQSNEERNLAEKEKESREMDINDARMSEAANIVDKADGESHPGDVDWDAYSRHKESETPIPSSMSRRDDEFPNYENIVTKASTLNDHLMEQIGEIDFDEEEQRIATLLIGNIDERGYLQTTVEEIAEAEGLDPEIVEGVLDTIHRFDPIGVGSRSLQECLSVQLRLQCLRNGIVEKIVESHLHDLETRNYNAIAKALKIPLETVIENVQIIADLEPVPGRQFGADATQYVVPDVYVFKLGNEWHVGMNEDGIPSLQVSKVYQDLLQAETQMKGDDKEYLSDKLKSAMWLIRSIQQRQRTIYRVTECIVQRQMEFFEKGVEHLKPMILKDIAEDVEMHESTISRVTTNKFVHTPRGIFELKYFFNSSVSRTDGESMASESVKRMIADIIKEEDPKKPYSDQKIVDMLEDKGIQLARRTVAKYREQLNILPSSKRKKYF